VLDIDCSDIEDVGDGNKDSLTDEKEVMHFAFLTMHVSHNANSWFYSSMQTLEENKKGKPTKDVLTENDEKQKPSVLEFSNPVSERLQEMPTKDVSTENEKQKPTVLEFSNPVSERLQEIPTKDVSTENEKHEPTVLEFSNPVSERLQEIPTKDVSTENEKQKPTVLEFSNPASAEVVHKVCRLVSSCFTFLCS